MNHTQGLTWTDEQYYRDQAAAADRLLNALGIVERQAGLGETIETERDLWTQLADETRTWLARQQHATHADAVDGSLF